jgi:hypothetical protein
MQVFVGAWINQCKRHNLSSELVIVEWNPPADKPKLAEALRWPGDTGPCQVRIIEVPAELHRRYRHAAALPLYQMIAKNVGIRRAGGEFILATNIDVVFSDELVRFLAQRKLQKGRIYRMDRTDVGPDVPVDGSLDEQLAYCGSHVIRLCARDGIFTLTPDGMRKNEAVDIARPGSGIYFGSGWFEVERYMVEHFRWIRDEAELFLRVPHGGGILVLEVEPGPGMGVPPHYLHASDRQGTPVAEWIVAGRTTVRLSVPPASGNGLQLLRLRVPSGGRPVPHDTRVMNFRFFRCDWVDPAAPVDEMRPFLETVKAARPTLARLISAGVFAKSLSFPLQGPGMLRKVIRLLRMRGSDIFDAGAEYQIGAGWHELERHGAERFRWADGEAELLVRFNDYSASVALVVEPGPSIGYRPFDLVVRLRDGEVLRKARIAGLTYVEFPLPIQQGQLTSVFLKMEGESAEGIAIPGDTRILNFRVFACGRGTIKAPAQPHAEPATAGFWTARTVGTRPPDVDWQVQLKDQQKEIAEMGKPQSLHLCACGDFQLMSRESWMDVRGYPELDQFSIHLDSILGYAVHHLGVQEEVLPEPMRVYHIEHDVGTGWTPQGHKELSERIAKKGIQTITFEDLTAMVAQMHRLNAPLIFNLDNWGLAEFELLETAPRGAVTVPPANSES